MAGDSGVERRADADELLALVTAVEHLNLIAYRREGIPLNAATLADLRRTAEELGVDTARYAWL